MFYRNKALLKYSCFKEGLKFCCKSYLLDNSTRLQGAGLHFYFIEAKMFLEIIQIGPFIINWELLRYVLQSTSSLKIQTGKKLFFTDYLTSGQQPTMHRQLAVDNTLFTSEECGASAGTVYCNRTRSGLRG